MFGVDDNPDKAVAAPEAVTELTSDEFTQGTLTTNWSLAFLVTPYVLLAVVDWLSAAGVEPKSYLILPNPKVEVVIAE